MYPKLLTGGPVSARSVIPKPLVMMAVLVSIAMVLGAVYLGWNFVGREAGVSSEPRPVGLSHPAEVRNFTTKTNSADQGIDDIELHIEHVRRSLTEVGENAKRAQVRLRQVGPSLDQYYLTTSRERLQTADAALDAIFRSLAAAQDELEIVKTNTTRRH